MGPGRLDAAEARREAHAAAAAVWAGIGRPATAGGGVQEANYIWLHDSFTALVKIRFAGQLSAEDMAAIVESCLQSFLAPLYVRHVVEERVSPEDLLVMVDNKAIDRMGGDPICDRSQQAVTESHDEEDAFIRGIFGQDVTAEGYRSALRAVRLTGQRVEYLVVTQFVDLTSERTPRPEDVASRLASALPGITDHEVQTALLRFSGRLARLPLAEA